MKFGYSHLEELLNEKSLETKDLVNLLEITPQAIQNWKTTNNVPSRRISQLADIWDLPSRSIDLLMGTSPLHFEFRTKRGEHYSDADATERMRVRSEKIYERFFENSEQKLKYDFTNLRSCISKSKINFIDIANCIRSEFTIPDYVPFGSDELHKLQWRIGVSSFYLPFKQIKLNIVDQDDFDQSAILFSKDNSYSILIDSDRTIDEAHFDRMHEVVHIIFDGLFEQSPEIEDLIDLVVGELIYPKRYLIERYFEGDSSAKPIKNKKLLVSKFLEDTHGLRHILSPRGLARALRDTELTSRNAELFKFLNTEFHEKYRETSVTYSSYGEMDFEFSNRDELLKFYSEVVEKKENAGFYPLFTKLKRDLVTEKLDVKDLADTFSMKLPDAMLIKALWAKKE